MGRVNDLSIRIDEAAAKVAEGDPGIQRVLKDAMTSAMERLFDADDHGKKYREFIVLTMDCGTVRFHVHLLIHEPEQYGKMIVIACKYRQRLMVSGLLDLPYLREGLVNDLEVAGLDVLKPRTLSVEEIWCDGSCERHG